MKTIVFFRIIVLSAFCILSGRHAPAQESRPGIECGCDKTGNYVPPDTKSPVQAASSPEGKYTLSVHDASEVTPNTRNFIIRHNGKKIFDQNHSATEWGFSPDDDRFVMHGMSLGFEWVSLVNLDPDPSTEDEDGILYQVIPDANITSPVMRFSPHGKYLLIAAITYQSKLMLHVFDCKSGESVYSVSNITVEGLASGESVAGWGFSPDTNDAAFVHSYLTDVNRYSFRVMNLSKNPAEEITSNSNILLGHEYWWFSPCGDKFARVFNDPTGIKGNLYSTNEYNDFISFPTANYKNLYSTAESHLVKNLDGTPDPITENTADNQCDDVKKPVWSNGTLSLVKAEGTTIEMQWSGATDESGVTAYRIYLNGVLLKEVKECNSYKAEGLTPLTQCTFRIAAGDPFGNWSSENNPQATFSTLADEAPSWPDNALSYTGNTETRITLTWKEALDDWGIIFYKIFVDGIVIDSLNSDKREYKVSKLIAGTTHTFIVKAVDASGFSVSSKELVQTMEPSVDPSWPGGAALSVSDRTETTITLGWPDATDNCNAIKGYKICMNGDTIGATLAGTRSYLVKDLSEGITYTFEVLAVDESGNLSTPLTEDLSTLPGFSEFPLVVKEGDQKEPDISDKLVVWWDDSKDDGDIYAYNLEKETITQITKEPHAQFGPVVSGERIVWTDNRNGNWDIYMYDPVLGEVPVCTNAASQDLPAIDGDYIVWRDSRNGDFDIYMYDIASGKESPVSTHSGSQNWPDVAGKYVVYADNRNGSWDIFTYSINDKKETSIFTGPGDQTFPVISGTNLGNIAIAYMDSRNGDNIYIYYPHFFTDLQYEYLVPLDQFPAVSGQYYPHLSDKQLVYQDKLGGAGTDWNIYAFQMRNETMGTVKQICVDPVVSANQTRPRTAKGNIVWQDERNGNSDIYIWRRPPGADLRISLREITDPIVVGDTLKYIVSLTNDGPGINTSIEAKCTLPVMAKFFMATADAGIVTSEGKTLTWNIDTLRNEASADLEIVLVTFDLALLEFNASVKSAAFDPDPSNNEISETTKVKNFVPGRVGEGAFPSMQVDQDGRVHIVYFGNDSSLVYATRTRKGKWDYKTLETFVGGVENDMLTDVNGNINIVMSDARTNLTPAYRLYYGILTKEGEWSKKIIALSNIGFRCLSLKADSRNELHLVYHEAYGSAAGGQFFEMSTNTGIWSQPVAFSSGYDHLDMVIDENDNMHISFYDINTGIGYQKKTAEGGWSEPVAVEPGWRGAQLEGMVTSIFTDNLQNPHISYAGQVNKDSREDIKYAWYSGGKWNISMVDIGHFQSAGNKVVLDTDGKANFSYINNPVFAGDVRYASNIAGPWIKQIVDENIGSMMVDMGRDQDKFTHITYNGSDGSVYYALLPQIEYFEIDPDTLDFGLLDPGSENSLWLKLSNPLSKDIRIDSLIINDGRISLEKTSFILRRFASDSVKVTFKQTADPWTDNNLRIWYNCPSGLFMDIPVTAKTRQPRLSIDQAEPIYFGVIPSGTSVTKIVKLSNTGFADLIISGILVQGYVIFGKPIPTDFSLAGHNCTVLKPGETCDVEILFQAGITSYQTSFLKITSNDLSNPLKQITIYGEIAYPQISFKDGSGDIGFCNIGQSVTKSIAIKNIGQQNLNITSAAIYGTDYGQFSLNNPCTVIAPGDSCRMQVTLTPSRAGDLQATLTITSNSRYSNVLNIPLSGTSVARTLKLSLNNMDFGSVNVGEQAEELLELRNTGSTDLEIKNIQISGGDQFEFSQTNGCSTLSSGAVCFVTVRFIPAFEGEKASTLTVTSNDSENPVQTVALEGHAGASAPLQVSISAAPDMGQEPLNVQFNALGTGGQPPYSYFWEFDDLKSSNETSPVHVFTGPGIYHISLIMRDVNNQAINKTSIIAVSETGKPGILSGKIWDETGLDPVLKSNAVLYPQGDITDTTLLFLNEGNSFVFASLPAGKYTVLAIPDPLVYPEDLPTYLGDNVMMYNALWVQVDGQVTGQNIRLVKKPPVTSGSGNISGNIVSGAGKGLTVTEITGAVKGDPLSNIYVYLTDASDGKIKAFDISGEDGTFSFEGLDNGSYHFLADYRGLPMDPANTPLVISDARKDIEIQAIVGTDRISVTDLATGIGNGISGGVKVYPLPVKEAITILIPEGLFKRNSVRMKILNLSGKYVYINNNYDLSGNPVTLDLGFLNDGSYLLEMTDNEKSVRVKIVKMR